MNPCKAMLIMLAVPAVVAAAARSEPSSQVPDPVKRPAATAEAGSIPSERDAVLATVNGEPIYLDDLASQLGRIHGSARDGQRSGFDLDQLMFRVVNDMLLGQEARAMGLAEAPEIQSDVSDHRDDLAVRLLEREKIFERAEPTDAEMRRAYEQEYRRITFRVLTALDREASEALFEEVRSGADMEALAAERSIDPYSARGGIVRDIARIDLSPSVANLAFSLQPGELGGPVRTDLGWSVIRVESFRDADPGDRARLEPFLRDLLRHRKSQVLRAELAAQARERHPVQVDQKLVQTVRPERLPDARLIPSYEDGQAVVASVGELTLTVEEYAKALRTRWKGVRNEEAALAAAPIILQKLIDQRLLLAEARWLGYTDRPEVLRSAHDLETQLLIPLYLEQAVGPSVKVSPEEMQAWYEEHKQEMRKPPRLHLAQITVEDPDEAQRIAALLREGADVGWLARQHSIDRFKEAGGDRGWLVPNPGTGGGNAKYLEAEAGDVFDPEGESGNYVVVMVTSRQEQGLYSFEEVSGNARRAVRERKEREAVASLMDKLRERSEIEIDEELLATLNISGTREETPQEEAGSPAHGH